MIAHYESHIKRPSIDKVKKFAHALNVSVEDLLDPTGSSENKKSLDNIAFRTMKKVSVIQKLPLSAQRAIFRLINSLAEKNNIEGNL